jgi:HSP20 family protein
MNIGSLIPWREKSNLPATRQDYFDPFVTFRREVLRMMDDFMSGFDGRDWPASTNGRLLDSPAVDIAETEKEIVVTAEMPGLDEKDIQLTVSGDLLTLKGEKKLEHEQKDGNGYRRERQFGTFSRVIRLPFEVKDENVEATYKKGVLTIHLPKPPEVQKPVRQIDIKAA